MKVVPVMLPAILLVLDVYPLRRLGGAAGWATAPARRVLLEKLPFAVLAVAGGGIALAAQGRTGALRSLTAAMVWLLFPIWSVTGTFPQWA